MLDYTNCNIEKVSVYHVGNKTNGEDLILPQNDLDISDLRLREMLLKYFVPAFKETEFFTFTFTNEDFTLNPIYNFACQVFDNKKSFSRNGQNIAKHLYERSIHPQIKSGDLFVALISDVAIDDELTSVIGIFKSENRHPFFHVAASDKDISLSYLEGISLEKLDKACLIIDSDRGDGLKVCIVDKSNRSLEAQYWRDDFLMLKEKSDGYHFTNEVLTIAKKYVTKQLSEEFEVSKADQIDLLNRSMEYFKSNDSFDKKEFEKTVFQDQGMIKSFRKFNDEYRNEHSLNELDDFDISKSAVKKQNRAFKNVLRLDRNFDIYIHGNRELIEQGVERDGRKYYKIYFEHES